MAYVRLGVLVTVTVKIKVFCDMTPCSVVDGYRRISEEPAILVFTL
jgi:hypothetical protein